MSILCKRYLLQRKVLLQKYLNTTNFSLVRLLFLGTSGLNNKDSNTVTTNVTSYICTKWSYWENHRDKLKIWKKISLQRKVFKELF